MSRVVWQRAAVRVKGEGEARGVAEGKEAQARIACSAKSDRSMQEAWRAMCARSEVRRALFPACSPAAVRQREMSGSEKDADGVTSGSAQEAGTRGDMRCVFYDAPRSNKQVVRCRSETHALHTVVPDGQAESLRSL